jgi:TatD DNase family protein
VPLVDTHCHLQDEQFSNCVEAVLQRARQADVQTIVAVGTTAANSEECIALAARFPLVYASVGIHPNHCNEVQPGDWERIVAISRENKVVALGETGLDRYWKDVPFPTQQEYFDRHIRLSQQTDLPFIVHMRDCDEDILLMLREARQRGPLRGVMHSLTGTQQTLEECIAHGMYISFAGMVTYKKSDELRRMVKLVPQDKILVETDSPYLSPHPFRSQRPNEPALIVNTAQCVANERGMSLEDFARLTSENAARLFGF